MSNLSFFISHVSSLISLSLPTLHTQCSFKKMMELTCDCGECKNLPPSLSHSLPPLSSSLFLCPYIHTLFSHSVRWSLPPLSLSISLPLPLSLLYIICSFPPTQSGRHLEHQDGSFFHYLKRSRSFLLLWR